MAITGRETLLPGLRQTHLGAADPARWRNPRQRTAATQLSNGKVQRYSDGLGAAHDEILAKVENMAAEERKAAELSPAAVTTGNGKTVPSPKPRDDLMSRLLKFVSPFKRYS